MSRAQGISMKSGHGTPTVSVAAAIRRFIRQEAGRHMLEAFMWARYVTKRL